MADLNQVALLKSDVKQWNMWRKTHPGVIVNLDGADLRGANFSNYFQETGQLIQAYLSGASLRGANLSRLALNYANLSGASLEGADLSGASLGGASLRGADLRRADLREANLNLFTNLRSADLSGADLSGADLSGADLRRANLSGANLSLAYFGGADLTGADLRGATLSGADFTGADLTRAKRDATSPKSPTPGSTSPSLGETIVTALTSQDATSIANLITIATGLVAFVGVLRHVARHWSKEHSTDSEGPKERPSRPSESDIVAIHLRMTHGHDHEFEEWLTDPDRLKHYIDVFNQPSSAIKPLLAVFVKRNGKMIKVDVSEGTQINPQLNEILGYLHIDSEQK